MTGFIVSVFPFRNRVSSKEAFEVLELGEGKLSRPVLRGPGGRKAAWLLGSQRSGHIQFGRRLLRRLHSVPVDRKRGRITFLDREARTGAAKVVSADVGKLSGCLGFIPETSAEF